MEKEDILNFWFKECEPKQWFNKDHSFDHLLKDRFGNTVDLAFKGKLDKWMDCANGLLALIIILDQLPRNIFRDTPLAFSGDQKALSLSFFCTKNSYHFLDDVHRRHFMLIPRMHSEDLKVQNDSLLLFKKLGLGDVYNYAVRHRDIVARFGRFPHRNSILGRLSTKDELAFLEQKGSSF